MNPGHRITQYQVASLFGDAYCATGNRQKCINGFRVAGIYPLNSNVFTDVDFQAAENLMRVPETGTETTHANAGGTMVADTSCRHAEAQLEPAAVAVPTGSDRHEVELEPADTTATSAGSSVSE